MSLKEQLKALRESADADLVKVEVEGLPEPFYVRPAISARDMARLEKARNIGREESAVEVFLISARDENGKRLFNDSERADIEAMPHWLLMRISKELDRTISWESPEQAEKKS